MSETTKDILRSVAISIGMAMTIFCIVGVIFDITYQGQFSLDNYRFTKMVLGCLIVGLGFGVPTVIYRKENLPMPVRGRLDRRIEKHRSWTADRRSADRGCFYHLVSVQPTLPQRG